MIQVINRAMDILECIAKEPDHPKSLSEIAKILNLNSGTCANIIKTLVTRKYIEQTAKRKGYILGSKAFSLTGNQDYKKDLITAAKKEMTLLVDKFNENALLAVLNEDIRSAVLSINGTQDLQAVSQAEKRAYNSSSGRLLISMLSDEELKKFVENYGLPTNEEWVEVKDFDSLYEQIKQIRADRCAFQVSKNQIIGIAVPVTKGNKVIASLSMYMPVFRFNIANQKYIKDFVNKTGERIGKNLSK